MRAVILAGGRGTRLRPYTTVLPKPLVPVGDRPILELIIRQLSSRGFERVDLCVGHLGELIRAYFSEALTLGDGPELRYHWENRPLGTAGALHQIEDLDEPFLVMNGDILTDLDFGELMRFHRGRDATLTIASHQKQVPLELGVIDSDDGFVRAYTEKPTLSFTVSMGIYVYEPAALRHVPAERFDFPDLVKALLAAGERVALYPFDGTWFDIGTPSDHQAALAAVDADLTAFLSEGGRPEEL